MRTFLYYTYYVLAVVLGIAAGMFFQIWLVITLSAITLGYRIYETSSNTNEIVGWLVWFFLLDAYIPIFNIGILGGWYYSTNQSWFGWLETFVKTGILR
jgi:hypothetical protein